MRILSPIALLILWGCWESPYELKESVDGYVPIYGSKTSLDIILTSPRSIKNPGKIYQYQNLLFVNEINFGVHVIDNTDPSQPSIIHFIEILGNNDFAIRNDIMYADHMGDLVAIKLNDFVDIEKIGQLPISNWLLGLPPPGNSQFECVNSNKGLVVGWHLENRKNWDCYAF